jgi:putative transcriptional regulator
MGDENASDEDWRDVRAKLIMQYSKEQNTATNGSDSTTSAPSQAKPTMTTSRWLYDSKGTIEVGSLIVSHPSQDSACGGLRQQHFHKCIILVIDHSREGTIGIILNRPTNQIIHDKRKNEWKCHFGGNTKSIGSEDESLGCLYRRSDVSQVRNGMALPIIKNIGVMPWDIAQVLIDEKEVEKEAFCLYRGYTKWGPGCVEKELERGDWFTVATDNLSLWDIIVQDSSFATGTDKWVQVMNRIGKRSLVSSTPNQKFQDDMLKQYMRLRLLDEFSQRHRTPQANARAFNPVPGTLLRSSAPFLLNEQFLHQSLVLILKNDDSTTVGVVLNRPYSTSIRIAETNLPVRYGGRYKLEDEGMPDLVLHYDHQRLQDARVGEPISKDGPDESIFWKCSREDAEAAVKAGLADADDFLIIDGLSVWNKGKVSSDLAGVSSSELENFSKVDDKAMGTIWKLLKVQQPLNKKNAEENLEAANTAWMLSDDAAWIISDGSKPFDFGCRSEIDAKEREVVQSLAASALDKWIRTYLLKP